MGLPSGSDNIICPNFLVFGVVFVFLVVPHGVQDSISQPGNQT